METEHVTSEAYACANIPFRARKEAACRLSANASCTKCAMLTGFDDASSSIMVLVDAPMDSEEMGINGPI